MSATKTARDIMRVKLVTLRPWFDVFEAVSLLLKNQISGAPVVEGDGTFLGVFSERNCMNLIVSAAYDQMPSNTIEAFMDRVAPTICETTDLLSIAETFQRTGARRLPVLDGTQLVGQISRRDLMREVHDQIRFVPPGERSLLYLSSLTDRENAPIR